MGTSGINELHKIWLKFLNTTKTEEGEVWLDAFLEKYLELLCNSNMNTTNNFSFQWRSSGNILAHQLLSDMYQICETVKSNSSSILDSLSVSEHFKKYLLEGRGWKILWTLESIGIQNLLCLRDLIKLLVLHVPVLLSLPLCESNIPDVLHRKPKNLSLSDCFILSKRNKITVSNIKLICPESHISKKKRNYVGKKRIRRKRLKAIQQNLDSSSGEDPILFEPVAIPASQLKSLQKVNRINPVPKSDSESEETEIELSISDSLLRSNALSFNNCHISVADYMHFMLNLLQESAMLDHRNSEYMSHSSPLILEFSLNMFKDLYNGRYEFDGWSKEAINHLQTQLLKIVFLSASVTYSSSTYTGAPNENEVLSILLAICEDILLCPTKLEENVLFASEAIKGCLMLVYNTIELYCEEIFSKVIDLIKTFLATSQSFYYLISHLDKLHPSDINIDLNITITLIKDIIVLLKYEKLTFCANNTDIASNVYNLIHHHNDILGPSANFSIIHKEPVCSIAKLCSLLLEILNLPVTKETCSEIVRQLKICGICCCVNPGYVMKTVFGKFSFYDLESQHYILMLVEKYLFCQLGLSVKCQTHCTFCSKRIVKNDFLSIPFVERLINATSLDSKLDLLNDLDIGVSFWCAFSIYNELLNSSPPETIEYLAKHLIQIFSDGIEELRIQLYMRVILRQYLELNSDFVRNSSHSFTIKSQCVLTILQMALHDSALAALFVHFEGISILYKFLLLPKFRQSALTVLKMLIFSEINIYLEGKTDNIFTLLTCTPASSTFCSFIQNKTQSFYKKLKLLFCCNESCDTPASLDIWEDLENVLGNLFDSHNPLIEENIDIQEEEIQIICDTWKCYQDIIANSSTDYFQIISETAFECGYKVLFLLLENLNTILTIEVLEEKPEIATSLLLLIQNLLSVSITIMKEVPKKVSFLEAVKTNLKQHYPKCLKYLGLLFDFILKCCCSSVSIARSSSSAFLKSNSSCNITDNSTTSENEESDINSTNENYFGDTEGTIDSICNNKTKYDLPYHSVIEHGEVVKILLDLLIHFQSNNSCDWAASALHIMQVLTKLCQDFELNKKILCNQGIPSLLLESFAFSLKEPDLQLKEYQAVTMELFTVLSEYTMHSSDLKKILNFFKSPHAPMTLLLKCLNNMVDNMIPHPVWSLNFPSTQLPTASNRIKKRLKLAYNAHKMYSASVGDASPWSVAAMCFPLTEDTRWNSFNKGFSFTLWLKVMKCDSSFLLLTRSNRSLSLSKTSSKSDNDLFGDEKPVLHLISIGSEKCLLELWYDNSDNDLEIRLTYNNDNEVFSLSKGICKSLFHYDVWHHLAVNYNENSTKTSVNSRVQIILDGTKENLFNWSAYRSGNLLNNCYILLGHSDSKHNENNHCISTYNIGNLLLFKGDCLTRDIIFYLSSLGPNMSNITGCAIQRQNSFIPEYNQFSNLPTLISLDVFLGLKIPAVEHLQDALICCYTPENNDVYLVYPSLSYGFFPLRVSFVKSGSSKLNTSQDGLYSRLPKALQILNFGTLNITKYCGFQCAVQQAGGIIIFIFLFAYILENSNDIYEQATCLDLILKLISKDSDFEEDLYKLKGYELLTQMIMSENCVISTELIQVLKRNCLKYSTSHEGPFTKFIPISEKTIQISNGAIFSLMFKSISFSKNVSPEIITSLYTLMDCLLNPKSSKLRTNIEQMNHVEILKTTLWILKKKFVLGGVLLPVEALKAIPLLMQKLLWYKFDGLVFQSICNFMLMLHKSSTAYVCHSRSAFFFLFLVDKIGSEKRFSNSTWYVNTSDFFPFQPTFPSFSRELSIKRHISVPAEQSQASEKNPLKLPRPKSADNLVSSSSNQNLIENIPFQSSSNPSPSHLSLSLADVQEEVDEINDTEFVNVIKNNQSSELYTGLLHLINSFIIKNKLPKPPDVSNFIQPEIFIVLAYTINSEICASVLKVIHSYLLESDEIIQEDFLKIRGFHLLANQLHQHRFNKEVFDVCFSFAYLELDFCIKGLDSSSKTASTFKIMSWLPLLSMLPNSYHEHELCEKAIRILTSFLQSGLERLITLLENGLIISISHLIIEIIHSNDKLPNKNFSTILEMLYNMFKVISFELCSSKLVKDFYTLCDTVNIFAALEKKCLEECGPDFKCTACWRMCLCSFYQVIFEFLKLENFQSSKDQPLFNDKSSVWELLTELQETVGNFNQITVNVEDIQREPTDLNESTVQMDVEKVIKEIPVAEIIDRIEALLEGATHFVVFKDPRIKLSNAERTFTKNLFNFFIKGLCNTMDRNMNIIKSAYTNLMCNIKDSLKKQLGRLLFTFLSPSQDHLIQEYVIDILATHPLSAKILQLVVFTITKTETLFAFLIELQLNNEMSIKKNAFIVLKIVKNILKEDTRNLDFVKNPQVMQKLNLEWIQSWKEDRLKWNMSLQKINDKTFQRFELLAQEISNVAFNVTQKVFEIQNVERKLFMEELKKKYYDEASERKTWLKLIEQMTHEKAVWHLNKSYPNSWELDPTEGPLRIRRRLKRCYLNIDDRFIREDCADKLTKYKGKLPFVHLLNHQNDFSDSAAVLHRLHNYEQIQYTSPCKIVTAFEEVKLEILVGACCIHLIGEDSLPSVENRPISESWPFETITEIVPRRYELQNNAFEIFLSNGLTYLIAFDSEKDFQSIWKQLEDHNLPCKANKDVSTLTQLWRENVITNFEYLTQLNKLSGRSFNDLMQYPVFPFILSDYRSPYLNLYDPTVYRNLEKPVAVQHKYREQFYMDTYEQLKEQAYSLSSSEPELPISGPYHYGSHYSNSGTVLHFLIRILPYTYSFIKYQDNNFDIPDRTFHSMETSWQLVTKDSTSDVKELIPEFFFLPEFLSNKNGFDFGVRQSGIRVNDVLLPPWCKQNPRLFILIHRQALESDAVTRNIHNWIDLIFGFKQTGENALSAINVFHPATYYGFDINHWKDPISKRAVKAMIKTLGQMPKQLFSNPHPMISLPFAVLDSVYETSETLEVVDTVTGLRWGNYVGSPSTGTPTLVWCRKQSVVLGKFLPLLANYMFALGENICLLLNHRKCTGFNLSSATYIMSAALVSWGHKDNIIRIKLCRDQPAVPLLKGNILDPVCLCASVPDCRELFIAHSSGIIFVYTLSLDSNGISVSQLNPPIELTGHSDVITCIYICKPFSIFVSASKDKTIVIWDLNRLCYVRSLSGHEETVEMVCVSETLGDVASISNSSGQGCLKVWTINGETVGSVNVPDVVTSICYSTAPEGISVNVIATGLRCGNICLWSSWDLKPVREITCDRFRSPIKCIVFSMDNQHLFASNENGTVAVWEKPSRGLTSVPRLLVFT